MVMVATVTRADMALALIFWAQRTAIIPIPTATDMFASLLHGFGGHGKNPR